MLMEVNQPLGVPGGFHQNIDSLCNMLPANLLLGVPPDDEGHDIITSGSWSVKEGTNINMSL